WRGRGSPGTGRPGTSGWYSPRARRGLRVVRAAVGVGAPRTGGRTATSAASASGRNAGPSSNPPQEEKGGGGGGSQRETSGSPAGAPGKVLLWRGVPSGGGERAA